MCIFDCMRQSYEDKGPVIDAVVWHDGEVWRVALDTQSLEDDPESGKLADFAPLTNYKYTFLILNLTFLFFFFFRYLILLYNLHNNLSAGLNGSMVSSASQMLVRL